MRKTRYYRDVQEGIIYCYHQRIYHRRQALEALSTLRLVGPHAYDNGNFLGLHSVSSTPRHPHFYRNKRGETP